MKNFKVLSYDEELLLSPEDLIKYYGELKNYLLEYKENILKKGYINTCGMLNKNVVRFIIDKIKGYNLTVLGQDNIPDGPVIYASTHQDYHDHFNVVLSIPEHAIILNTSNVTPLFKLLLGTNGIVYVDRDDNDSRFASKMKLMEYLAKGKSVVVFPEATFNCSPNKLHLPLHSGVVDMARKMQVPIVPLIQEYEYIESDASFKNVISCTAEFGKPIYVEYRDNLKDKLEELSTQFSTIRWKLIEEKKEYSRESITNEEYINYVLSRIDGWRQIKVNIEDERKYIKGFGSEDYIFSFINDVLFDNMGNLLLPSEVRKLEKINEEHLDYCFNRDGDFVDVNKVLKLSKLR